MNQSNQRILIIIIFISLFLVVSPFLLNPIKSYDGPSHLLQADFIKNNTWPRTVVWNPFFFFGFEENQFYPPLFYFLVATLSFIFSLESSAKIIVILSYIGLFLFCYLFTKDYFSSETKGILATALLFTLFSLNDWAYQHVSFYGLNFSSTINGGLFPTVLSGMFLFALLYFLEKSKQNKKYSIYASIMLGLAILSHFIGLIGIIFTLAYLLKSILVKNKKQIINELKTLVIGISLSAWWLVPFITRLNYSEKIELLPDRNLFYFLFILLNIITTIFVVKTKKFKETTIITWGILLLLFFSTIFIQTQIFRLTILYFIFVLFEIIWLIEERYCKNVCYVLLILSIIFLFGQTFSPVFQGTYNLENYDGTILSAAAPYYYEAHHDIAFTQPYLKNNTIANGLFVESSLSSYYVFSTLLSFDPETIWWGVPGIIIPEKDNNYLEKKVEMLGIKYIISDLNFSKSIASPKKVGEQTLYENNQLNRSDYNGSIVEYYIYEIKTTPIIEALPYKTIPFNGTLDDWKHLNKKWFLKPTNTIFVMNGTNFGLNNDANVYGFSYGRDYQTFSFTIDSNIPTAVYIRQSYYPTWHAYADGVETPIYLASPNFMIIEAKGNIEFRQQPDYVDYLGWSITIISILAILIFLAKLKRKAHL